MGPKSKQKQMMVVDKNTVKEVIQFVKKKTPEEKMDMLLLQAKLHFEHLQKKPSLSPRRK